VILYLKATIAGTPYYNNSQSTQTIDAAEYYIEVPPWISGAVVHAMSGSFSSKKENVQGTIKISGLSSGKHIIFVRAKDAGDNCGQGQLMLQQVIKEEKTEIDISNFSQGVYIFKVNCSDFSDVIKLVKE
jgi:hypothetical protein